MNLAVVVLALALGAGLVLVPIYLLLSIDRGDLYVSKGCLRDLQVRTNVSVDHEIVSGDGSVVVRHQDEAAIRALRSRLEESLQ